MRLCLTLASLDSVSLRLIVSRFAGFFFSTSKAYFETNVTLFALIQALCMMNLPTYNKRGSLRSQKNLILKLFDDLFCNKRGSLRSQKYLNP